MSDTAEAQELTLDLQVQEFSLGTLVTNAEAIRDAVKAKLEGYSVENYSGDRIQDAKRDKAELNAAAKRLNDARLEYERRWMKPFEAFKAVVNETVCLIKTASSAIDQVVKDVEQGEKDEKRRLIESYWVGLGCNLFTLAQIFDERWLNKTVKLAAVQDEIDKRVEKVKADLVILERLNEPEARAHYLNTLDLTAAIDQADRIKRNRERIEAEDRARAEAAAKRKADEEARALAVAEAKEADKAGVAAIVDEILEEESLTGASEEPPDPKPEPPAPEPPKLYELTLKFSAPRDKLEALRAFLDEQGIAFERIA